MIDRRHFIVATGAVLTSSLVGRTARAAEGDARPPSTFVVGKNERAPIIRVLGVGGAGCNIVEQIRREAIPNLDRTVLIGRSMEKRHLDLRLDSGVDCGLSELDAAAIHGAVRGSDLVYVLAGLGGATGTRIAPLVAETAKAAGSEVVAVVTEPFDFEAERRDVAKRGLCALSEVSGRVIRFSNEERAQRLEMGEEVTLATLYAQVNDKIVLRLHEMVSEFAAVS